MSRELPQPRAEHTPCPARLMKGRGLSVDIPSFPDDVGNLIQKGRNNYVGNTLRNRISQSDAKSLRRKAREVEIALRAASTESQRDTTPANKDRPLTPIGSAHVSEGMPWVTVSGDGFHELIAKEDHDAVALIFDDHRCRG